jgi:hypothetical protein
MERARANGAGRLRVGALWHEAGGRLRSAARRLASSRAVHGVARAGFVVKAALYGIIGAQALRAGLGRGGATLDAKGALERLTGGRLGALAVAAAGAGIGGLGIWFVLDAIANPRGHRGTWAAISRVGQAIGGAGYAGLGVLGFQLAAGEGAGPDVDTLARAGVAEAFRFPGGPALAVLVGAVAVAVGVRQAHLGLSRGFLETVDLSPATPAFRRLAAGAGALGFAVQGTLFALVGLFLVLAVVRRDPGEATGTGGALQVLAARSHGKAILVAASLGLFAYALYAGIEGACKRFPGPAPAGDPGEAGPDREGPAPGRAMGHGEREA